MSEWETFCDNSYFDLWRVRRKNERGFDDGYHLQHGAEAKELVELLNRLERERDEARDMVENLTDHGLNLMDSNRMLKRERDEAREALREIQAADWKTAGELRGMARKVLEAAK